MNYNEPIPGGHMNYNKPIPTIIPSGGKSSRKPVGKIKIIICILLICLCAGFGIAAIIEITGGNMGIKRCDRKSCISISRPNTIVIDGKHICTACLIELREQNNDVIAYYAWMTVFRKFMDTDKSLTDKHMGTLDQFIDEYGE